MPRRDNRHKDTPKTHEKFRAGPIEDRSCTDCLFFLLFIGFCGVGAYFISAYALTHGNPEILAQPYDPDHRPCGVGDLKDYPYIYFATPVPNYLYRTVCVASCPKQGDDSLDCKTNSVVDSCDSEISASNYLNMVIVYESVEFGGAICLPSADKYFKQIASAINVSYAGSILGDIKNSWRIILGSILISIVVGFIFLCIVKTCAGCMVWTSILFSVGGFGALGYFFWTKYQELKQGTSGKASVEVQAEGQNNDIELYKWSSVIFFSLAAIIVLLVVCFFNRIRLAIAIMKCSARFVGDVKSALLVPIVFFLLTIGYIAYNLTILAYLASSGTVTHKPHSLPFGQFSYNEEVKTYVYAHIFSLLWNTAFLVGANTFVIIGSVSYWYFRRGGGGEVTKATWLLIRYHIGTVAFGSLIIAIIQALRIILEYISKQAEQATGGHNDMANFAIKCCECFLDCFERFIEFLNKNAYIQTVVTGNSFCTASKDAFFLLARNPIRAAMVSGLGELIEILGNVSICIGSTLICYIVITKSEYYTEKLQSPLVPTVCIGLISYTVGSFIMSLFGTAADCILILFCMDEEMHVKAKFEPEELRSFRDEHCQE